MTETNSPPMKAIEEIQPSKYVIGPGFGLFILGVSYLIWWIIFSVEYIFGPPPPIGVGDPRWAHNWVYAIIIITIGAAWYHKSVVSRFIATVQAFMMPLTSSGSFNTFVMTYITIVIAIIWGAIVATERTRGRMFLQDRLQTRSWNWINMHSIIVSWLLIAHMGLVFLIGRFPQEAQLLPFGVGFLVNLPPENLELATWAFDITLIIWAILVLYEQFKVGYNMQNKLWPRWSFWWGFVCMGSSLIALGIQMLIFG